MKNVFTNPLLIKQLREEMRSRKIFFVVPVYIALISIVALVAVGSNSGSSFSPTTLANDARITMFSFVVTISILLGLVTVVLGAASFTTEREKQTFELLELTPLSSMELMLGKFLHGFVVTSLILLSSLPVLATLFFMGGLTYADLFLTLLYLLVFFGVVLLGAICISIVSSRTILSIILSLGLAFVIGLSMAVATGNSMRSPQRAFMIISPWLVTYQQIFEPSALKIAGMEIPIWPIYFAIYAMLGLLFLCWGRNALDSRKLERNPWARILGIIFINGYFALGLLDIRSLGTITAANMKDFYQVIIGAIVLLLPCFVLGVLTDKDKIAFSRRPLYESVRPSHLFLNHPATAISYLLIVLASLSLTIGVSSGIGMMKTWNYAAPLLLWILPWFLLFIAMRLLHFNPRGLFVAYILGTILFGILSSFEHAKSVNSDIYDFFLYAGSLVPLYIVAWTLFVVAIVRSRKENRLQLQASA